MNQRIGTYGGLFGQPKTNQQHCAAAKQAKYAGKKTYKLINVDVQIGKFCKGAEAEVEALNAAKEAAGLGPGHRKAERRAERAARQGLDPALALGGLVIVGLGVAATLILRS